jgi:hypothetical protein
VLYGANLRPDVDGWTDPSSNVVKQEEICDVVPDINANSVLAVDAPEAPQVSNFAAYEY